MTITGTNSYTDTEEGNSVTGEYTRTKTGFDEWEMEINGTKVGGAYYQLYRCGLSLSEIPDSGSIGAVGQVLSRFWGDQDDPS